MNEFFCCQSLIFSNGKMLNGKMKWKRSKYQLFEGLKRCSPLRMGLKNWDEKKTENSIINQKCNHYPSSPHFSFLIWLNTLECHCLTHCHFLWFLFMIFSHLPHMAIKSLYKIQNPHSHILPIKDSHKCH